MRAEMMIAAIGMAFFALLGGILYAAHSAEMACINQGGTYAGTICVMCKSAE